MIANKDDPRCPDCLQNYVYNYEKKKYLCPRCHKEKETLKNWVDD